MIRRLLLLTSTLLLFAGCRTRMVPEREAIPAAEQEWDDLLKDIVSEDGYVDYDTLHDHRDVLDRYVAWLAEERPRARPNFPRMGFWLNAYNALVLYQVENRDQPDSVMDVGMPFPRRGTRFFLLTEFKVERDHVSLWEIEHERLRQKTLDFRVHAGINCASRSCPPLRNETYKAGRLMAQLNDQMRRWVNDPERGVRIEDSELVFNPIFQWFRDDFEFWTGGKSLCHILARYADQPLRKELLFYEQLGCPIRTYEYDWRLNDVDAVRSDP